FFVSTPQQYVGFLFFLKMMLVVAGALNVLYFMLLNEPWTVGEGDDASKKTKLVAASAIAIWVGVLFCGHMLPFLGNSFYSSLYFASFRTEAICLALVSWVAVLPP